ncbi:MAG TPA: phosphodiesterase [Candidatus Elarobacter sp.]|nr:phosphodiesterase [Candidatus Elarobacter sp.]
MHARAVLIAQITDTHVRRKGDLLHHMIHTGRELRRAVEALNAAVPRPSLVVATGDLVDRGKPKEYKRLRKILGELEMPVFLVPGNHDDRAALREAFPEHAYLPPKGPLCYAVESRPVRLVALDTTRRARAPGGELDDARLDWLDRTLRAAPATPTLIAMHHPPFEIGLAPLDAQALRGRAELARIVAAHPQVARIVCGHVHRFHEALVGGATAVSIPSTAHQLILEATGGGLPYTVRVEPPAFAFHRWTGRAIVTEIVRTSERETARPLRAVS